MVRWNFRTIYFFAFVVGEQTYILHRLIYLKQMKREVDGTLHVDTETNFHFWLQTEISSLVLEHETENHPKIECG